MLCENTTTFSRPVKQVKIRLWARRILALIQSSNSPADELRIAWAISASACRLSHSPAFRNSTEEAITRPFSFEKLVNNHVQAQLQGPEVQNS